MTTFFLFSCFSKLVAAVQLSVCFHIFRLQSESEIQQIFCKDSRILQGFQEINVQPDTAFSLLINKLRSDIFRIPLISDLQSRVSSG